MFVSFVMHILYYMFKVKVVFAISLTKLLHSWWSLGSDHPPLDFLIACIPVLIPVIVRLFGKNLDFLSMYSFFKMSTFSFGSQFLPLWWVPLKIYWKRLVSIT